MNHNIENAAVSTFHSGARSKFKSIQTIQSKGLRGEMDRNATLNSHLNQFTELYVKFRRDRKKEALRAWQPIVNAIVEDVKRRDQLGRFAKLRILHFGSYYEKAKVGEPDEFDLMLVIDNLELDGDPYDSSEDDGLNEPPIGKLTF